MEILPPRTYPPRTPTPRRHNPRPVRWSGGYSQYRACLRWDFGFICAFCLLHEVDFASLGAEGLGIFSAEHIELQSVDKDRSNDYENIVYACRWCNRARSVMPINVEGQRLLNPTEDAWADHFQVEENRLVPRSDDMDASHTHNAYQIDEDRKVALRRHRYEVITKSRHLINEGLQHIQELTNMSENQFLAGKYADGLMLIETVSTLRECINHAYLALGRFISIPADKPSRCRCNTKAMHSLPEEFSRQMQRI